MSLRILTWNVACLPKIINPLRNPNKKINSIIDKIISFNPNIINLQEVFDYKIQGKINDALKDNNFNTHYSIDEGMISKNGLLTASIFDITEKQELNYSMFTGPEYLIKKGLLSTTLDCDGEKVMVHNTHLQSNSMYYLNVYCSKIRQQQKKELIEHLSYYKEKDDTVSHILCGDLNDDFNSNEHHNFVEDLPFENVIGNYHKMVSFPKYEQQLDYIIVGRPVKGGKFWKASGTKDKLSDHDILLMGCEL